MAAKDTGCKEITKILNRESFRTSKVNAGDGELSRVYLLMKPIEILNYGVEKLR